MNLLLLSVYPPHAGGSAHSSRELAKGLRQLGHRVTYLAPYKQPIKTDIPPVPGLTWVQTNFPSGLEITSEAQTTIDAKLSELYCQAGPFDAVILGRESFVWHLPTIRQFHRGPVMLICRGAYINRLASTEPVEPTLRRQLIRLYRDCDVVVGIAQHIVSAVQQTMDMDAVQFIQNPIELPQSVPLPATTSPQQPLRLLMAAQIKSRKRPLDALEIMRSLVQQGHNVHLTVCGDGVDRELFLQRIAAYQLEQHIDYRGKVDRQNVLQLLKQTEIVLLCSDKEGRPRILQEAIAVGRGIVAYDNPGSREVVENWVGKWPYGRMVPIGAVAAAATAILDVQQQLRSLSSPLPTPNFPSPLQVAREYEATLLALQHPAVSAEPILSIAS